MISKKLKKIPKFNTESEEAEFWLENDSTEFIDWSKAERVKPKSRLISIRLPEPLINNIKQVADNKSLPYQTLIRVWLTEKLKEVE
jgi:predicted DNA binding CopG/RHH family protein